MCPALLRRVELGLARTPEMDRLAADGLILDRHHDTTPICMASRANIATGLYEYRTGTNFEHGQMTPELFSRSYHVLLRDAGYFTGFIGKFGFGVGDSSWPDVPHYYGDDSLLPADQFDWWRGQPGQSHYRTAGNPNMAYLADEFPHLTRAHAHVAGDGSGRHAGLKRRTAPATSPPGKRPVGLLQRR